MSPMDFNRYDRAYFRSLSAQEQVRFLADLREIDRSNREAEAWRAYMDMLRPEERRAAAGYPEWDGTGDC
jgi:hypothetical protein